MTELRVVVGSGPNAVAVTHALLQRGVPYRAHHRRSDGFYLAAATEICGSGTTNFPPRSRYSACFPMIGSA
jgi:hypothetical protein